MFEFYNNLLQSVSTHEAGHAVAGVVLGIKLESVALRQQLRPDGRYQWGVAVAPFTQADVAGKGEDVARPYLVQGFSGPIAEEKVNREYPEFNGGSNDRAMICEIAVTAICGLAKEEGETVGVERVTRVNALLRDAELAAVRLVDQYWPAIREVARLLRERQELNGEEVAEIVANARCRVPSRPASAADAAVGGID